MSTVTRSVVRATASAGDHAASVLLALAIVLGVADTWLVDMVPDRIFWPTVISLVAASIAAEAAWWLAVRNLAGEGLPRWLRLIPQVTTQPVSDTTPHLRDVTCSRCGAVQQAILGVEHAEETAAEHRDGHVVALLITAACCCAGWIACWVGAGYAHPGRPVQLAGAVVGSACGWMLARRINRS